MAPGNPRHGFPRLHILGGFVELPAVLGGRFPDLVRDAGRRPPGAPFGPFRGGSNHRTSLEFIPIEVLGLDSAEFGLPADDSVSRFILEQGLPIGISFYTLQATAFLIEVHRGTARAVGFLDVLLFESFFGQLIAGPIVRNHELMPQVKAPPRASREDILSGIELFALGFFKKMVLADKSAYYADPIFANPRRIRGSSFFLASFSIPFRFGATSPATSTWTGGRLEYAASICLRTSGRPIWRRLPRTSGGDGTLRSACGLGTSSTSRWAAAAKACSKRFATS